MIKKISVRKISWHYSPETAITTKCYMQASIFYPLMREVLLITLDGSEVPDVLADYLRRFQPDWVEKYSWWQTCRRLNRGVVYGRYFAGDPAAINAPFVLACRG